MKNTLALVLMVFGIVGCVSPEQAKILSDYEICLKHVTVTAEKSWEVYDNEKKRRDIDCNIYSSKIEKKLIREQEQSKKLQNLADTLRQVNENKSGKNTSNTKETKKSLKKRYLLKREYIEGSSKVCIYAIGEEIKAHAHKSKLTPCKPAMNF